MSVHIRLADRVVLARRALPDDIQHIAADGLGGFHYSWIEAAMPVKMPRFGRPVADHQKQ